MPQITVMDRLINKPVTIECEESIAYAPDTWIVYADPRDKNPSKPTHHVWELLGYTLPAEKKWTYIHTLDTEWLAAFKKLEEKADMYYQKFKPAFKEAFPDSAPITARMSFDGSQVYFYFYAENRYDFAEFVRAFRRQVRVRFFIYQVGARERVRLHPARHERYDANGLPLMYSVFKHSLGKVDSDLVYDQWLRGRSAERLKDWSGKLDHTLAFEQDIYAEEIPKYPKKWSVVAYLWDNYMCIWYNILTQNINLRGEERDKPWKFYGNFITITLDEYQTHATPVSMRPKKRPPADSADGIVWKVPKDEWDMWVGDTTKRPVAKKVNKDTVATRSWSRNSSKRASSRDSSHSREKRPARKISPRSVKKVSERMVKKRA